MGSVLGSLYNKPYYTIGELMNVDQGRQRRAGSCSVTLAKTYHELKKKTIKDKFRAMFLDQDNLIETYYITFRLDVISDTGRPHKVFIRVNPDFNLTDWQSNKVKIYCSCSDFKYRSAYKLYKNRALFINDRLKIDLGSAITDAPKSKTITSLLCKHSYAALQWLINNYSSLMKTI